MLKISWFPANYEYFVPVILTVTTFHEIIYPDLRVDSHLIDKVSYPHKVMTCVDNIYLGSLKEAYVICMVDFLLRAQYPTLY